MTRFSHIAKCLKQAFFMLMIAITCMSLMIDAKASPELQKMAKVVDELSELDSVHGIDYIDQVIAKADSERCDTIKSFMLLSKITLIAYFQSPEDASKYIDDIKRLVENSNVLEQNLYDAWFNVIMLSRSKSQTALAMQEIIKMLDYSKKQNSHYGMSTAYCLFADMYEMSYPIAVENLELALEHLIKGGYTYEQYEVYYQLAHLAVVHEKPDEILKNTKKMVEVKPSPLSKQIADHLNLQAYCLLEDHKNAQKCYERIQADLDNDNIGVGSINSAMGAITTYLSKYGDPNKITDLLEHVNEGNKMLRLEMEIKYNDARKDYKRALELYKELYQLEKDKMVQLQEAEVTTVNTMFKTAELKEAKQKLEIEEAATRHQRNVVLIIALAIMLAAAVYIIYATKKHNVKLRIERDNTEEQRKIAEAERNKAVRLNELKTQFLNTMSHEMRTPLNAIIGFNDILHNANINMSPEKRQEMIGHINFHSKQLMQLLDHVVILSRIDCNDAKPVPEDINVHDIIENLYYENMDRLPASVKFDISQIPDNLIVRTDSEFATIILREVIDNAIKFTKDGSIVISAKPTNDGVEVTIADTGCGLPTENIDHIYNRFEKFNSFEAGFGLGLSCCKELVDIIKSEISIDASYTQGASFTIRFINI